MSAAYRSQALKVGTDDDILRLIFKVIIEEIIVVVVYKTTRCRIPRVPFEQQLFSPSRATLRQCLPIPHLEVFSLTVEEPTDLIRAEWVRLLIIALRDIIE
jgi:hypothetical protein